MRIKTCLKNNIECTIRDATEKDFESILKLNEEQVRFLSPLTYERLELIFKMSECCLVVEINESVEAFMLCLREGRAYDSIYYSWFCENYSEFLYIDRIVVSKLCVGIGIGKQLYEYIFKYADEIGVPSVFAEIDIVPPNLPSLNFHKSFGFSEVQKIESKDGHKVLSLQKAETQKKDK